MPNEGKLFRVFIASPGDVVEERRAAEQILQRINHDPLLPSTFRLEIIMWEDTAVFATKTPQGSIMATLPPPSECDLVVVILWSRMGTPMPLDFARKPDGTAYVSGTEWEYEDAQRAHQQYGKPEILVFRRASEISLKPDDHDLEDRVRQIQKVQTFFDGFKNPDGSLKRGYMAYTDPSEFPGKFEQSIRWWIKKLANTPSEYSTRPSDSANSNDAFTESRVAMQIRYQEIPSESPMGSQETVGPRFSSNKNGEATMNPSRANTSGEVSAPLERWRQRLRFSVKEWERIDRNEAALLRGKLLEEAHDWYNRARHELSVTERAFIEQSLQVAKRERMQMQLARWSIIIASGLVVVLLLALIVPVVYERILIAMATSAGTLRTITGTSPFTTKPFAFEQFEVTNGRYALCVKAGRCQPPAPQLSTYFRPNSDNYPITGIDAFQAYNFCKWIGRRLPTASEWIYAATQNNEKNFPWGDEPPSPKYANLDYETGDDSEVRPVGSFPAGASRDGIMDLIGNVSEWTRTVYSPNLPQPSKEETIWSDPDQATYSHLDLMIGGGSYSVTQTGLNNMQNDFKAIVAPGDVNGRNSDQGFRCVSDLP
jgi:hypothetical protein